MRIVTKPLLNAEEAFRETPLGGAIEVDYAYGTLNNARQKLRSILPNRYRIKKSKESDKYLIIRIA